jgi:hypothetical protein
VPRELDGVIEGVMQVGAEYSWVTPVGPSWVVLDSALAVLSDLDSFRAIFYPADVDQRRGPPAGMPACELGGAPLRLRDRGRGVGA